MRNWYPTDVTDEQWEMIESFFSFQRRGFQPKYPKREILNAIFYVLRSGCAWRLLPHDFPKWTTVYAHFRKWEKLGLFTKLNDFLRSKLRQKGNRSLTPSGAIVDTQTVKTTEKGGAPKVTMLLKKSRGGRERFW